MGVEGEEYWPHCRATICGKILLRRIRRLNQSNFLLAPPLLEFRLPSNRIVYVLEYFVVDDAVHPMFAREAFLLTRFLLRDSGRQEARRLHRLVYFLSNCPSKFNMRRLRALPHLHECNY